MQTAAERISSESEFANDEELYAAYTMRGDVRAFEALVAAHRDSVFDFARRITGDAALAEDVAQDAFLKLFNRGAVKRPGVPVRLWLLGIARNDGLAARRAKRRRDIREDRYAVNQQTKATPDNTAALQTDELRSELEKLPGEMQLPIALHYLHGLSQPEVAAALGIPAGTAGSRIARGLERLRESFGAALPVLALENSLKALPLSKAPGSIGALHALKQLSVQAVGLRAGRSVALKFGLKIAAFAAASVFCVAAFAFGFGKDGNSESSRAAGGPPVRGPKGGEDSGITIAKPDNVGVVSFVKVVSDKVPDVSSMDAWKASYIKDGMSDEEKALAVWRTVATFQHQDSSVMEYLNNEDVVTDALKVFNVYGHSYCGMAAAHSMELARYAGMEARGWTINAHVVPEIKWDGSWHLLDSSLIEYFPKPDKKIASIEEIVAGVKDWYAKNPEYWDGKHGIDDKLRKFHAADGWTGWKKGPEILKNCPTYGQDGWVPARTHGWYSQMQEYDGTAGDGVPFLYEMGFSQGYQVNIQLRKGEKLTRNWSNKGLCMENQPGCLNMKLTDSNLAYSAKMFGDLSNGRIGNGTLEYDVPLAGGEFRRGALQADNLASKNEDKADPAVHVKDPGKDGVLVIRMPSSYIYLSGQAAFKTVVGAGGEVQVRLSDNNGLDWKDVQKITAAGEQTIDLKPYVYRRYDYRIMFVMKGNGTGLDSLKLTHDIQHSQRPLPALGTGENKIAFSAGTEGTITVEGSHSAAAKGKQLMIADFRPAANGVPVEGAIKPTGAKGDLTFPVETPGDITRVRFGLSGRVHDKADAWNLQISCDEGKTFKTVDTLKGPARFASKWVTASDIPAGTRKVLVRYAGENAAAAVIFNFRIDADYKEPNGGFRPVKVTYTWEENGQAKQDVHVAYSAGETYTIKCAAKPVMTSIVLELE